MIYVVHIACSLLITCLVFLQIYTFFNNFDVKNFFFEKKWVIYELKGFFHEVPENAISFCILLIYSNKDEIAVFYYLIFILLTQISLQAK